jgi:flagellar basal body-associated protein FliL
MSMKPEKLEEHKVEARNRVLSSSSFEDLEKEANDEKMKREAL